MCYFITENDIKSANLLIKLHFFIDIVCLLCYNIVVIRKEVKSGGKENKKSNSHCRSCRIAYHQNHITNRLDTNLERSVRALALPSPIII